MVSNTVSAVSTASACTSSVKCEMKMLESKLILNVTVFASEPEDHLADGQPMKDGMVAAAPLTLLPERAQVKTFWGMGLRKGDFRRVPYFDEWGASVLHGLGHDALPLSASTVTTKNSDTMHRLVLIPHRHGKAATAPRSLIDRKSITDFLAWMVSRKNQQHWKNMTKKPGRLTWRLQGGDAGAASQELRGYPETFSFHRRKIMQHPCGNETQGDRKERVDSA